MTKIKSAKTELKKSKSFRKRIFNFVKRWGTRLAVPLLIFHLGTQANFTIHDVYNELNPSPQRRQFEEEYGFPVVGWTGRIESDAHFSDIAEVVDRERLEGRLDLTSIRFESDNYLKRSIIGQLDKIVTVGYDGTCFWNRVFIKEFSSPHTLTHEIKHKKTFDILREHPEFKEEWEALAKDKDGKSLYRGEFITYCRQVRGLNKLLKDEKSSGENLQLGLVSDYARSNFYEDVAELCQMAEDSPETFVGWLEGRENSEGFEVAKRNPVILAKILLAEKYGRENGLLPRGFREYLRLEKLKYQITGFHGIIEDEGKLKQFLSESDIFLRKFSDSEYGCVLRCERAWFLRQEGVKRASRKSQELLEFLKHRALYPESATEDAKKYERELLRKNKEIMREQLEMAIQEYKKALLVRFKGSFSYCRALNALDETYQIIEDNKTARIFSDASAEYSRRRCQGDVLLSIKGVNDYLESRGISLDPHEKRKLEYIGGQQK